MHIGNIGSYLRGMGRKLAHAREDHAAQSEAFREILKLFPRRIRDLESPAADDATAAARRGAAALLREIFTGMDRASAPAIRPVGVDARMVDLLGMISRHAGSGFQVQFNPSPVEALAAFDLRAVDLVVGAFASCAMATATPPRWLAASTELQVVSTARYPHGCTELRLAHALPGAASADPGMQVPAREVELLQRLVRELDGALDVHVIHGVMTGIRLRMRVAKAW